MAYTIIRPGGLQNDDASGNGVLTEDTSVCGSITRADVADLVVKSLFSPKTDNKVGAQQPEVLVNVLNCLGACRGMRYV